MSSIYLRGNLFAAPPARPEQIRDAHRPRVGRIARAQGPKSPDDLPTATAVPQAAPEQYFWHQFEQFVARHDEPARLKDPAQLWFRPPVRDDDDDDDGGRRGPQRSGCAGAPWPLFAACCGESCGARPLGGDGRPDDYAGLSDDVLHAISQTFEERSGGSFFKRRTPAPIEILLAETRDGGEGELALKVWHPVSGGPA